MPILERLDRLTHEETVRCSTSVLARLAAMNNVDRPGGHEDVGGDYGAYRYAIGDRNLAESALGPAFVASLAEHARQLAEHRLGVPVHASPHHRSACTAKVFGPGDYQGWHLDTNPIAVLAYLTGGRDFAGGDIIAVDLTDHTAPPQVERLHPNAGDLVLVRGGHAWHGVEKIADGHRITLGFNLYLEPATPRPASVDAWIFGETQ